MRTISRRRFLALAMYGLGSSAVPLAATGCHNGFSIFGYQAGPAALYDENIHTVYVPLFNNRAFETNPYRGIEVDLTQAVVREIGKTTTFRVTSDYEHADTELLGNVVSITKNVLNVDQMNYLREGEVVLTVDVVWRDLRTGEILSNPRQRPTPGRTVPNPKIDALPPQFDPDVPRPPDLKKPAAPTPVRLIATGRFIPELGESNASGAQSAQKKMAVQIVSMMEKKW